MKNNTAYIKIKGVKVYTKKFTFGNFQGDHGLKPLMMLLRGVGILSGLSILPFKVKGKIKVEGVKYRFTGYRVWHRFYDSYVDIEILLKRGFHEC